MTSFSGAGQDIFLAKVTSSGYLEWAEAIGGDSGVQQAEALELREDPLSGNVELFLTGRTSGGGDLDPGPGDTLEDAADADQHGFLGKYHYDSANGSLTMDWLAARKTAGGWLLEIDVANDEVVGVGYSNFIGVFDPLDGSLVEETRGSSTASLNGVDRIGNDIVVSGRFADSADLDGDGDIDLVGNGSYRGFIGRFSYDTTQPFGSRLESDWTTSLGGSGSSHLSDVKAEMAQGNLYAAGRYYGQLACDGHELNALGSSDGLVLVLDPLTGYVQIAETLGGTSGDMARHLEVSQSGAIHVVGETSSAGVTFPNVPQQYITEGSSDGFLAVFTPVVSDPPIAVAGPAQNGQEDTLLTFDASGSSDPDGDPLTYRWAFGDGVIVETDTPTISHAFAYGGTFEVTLTVLDGAGNSDTATTWATVEEMNDVPVADAGGPYDGIENQAITFDASASFDFDNQDGSEQNNDTLTYLWDFGDDGSIDATTTETVVDHVFATAGTYDVRLTVDDGTATTESTTIVEISEIPAEIEFYIYDIRFESRRGGQDYRAVVEIRTVLGDLPMENVAARVDFAGTTYNLQTDGDGIARTNWERKLSSGNYYADAYDLALAGYTWASEFDLEDDSDGDGKADALITIA